MRQSNVIFGIMILATAATAALPCVDLYEIDGNGGKAWLGQNVYGYVAGEGQSIFIPCEGRLLSVSFELVLDGQVWNDASPLGTGDILVASLRLPGGGGFTLASVSTVINFDVGTEWVSFDFSSQSLDLISGNYVFTCHPSGTGQGRLSYWQGTDIYPEGVRYVSEGGGAGPWVAIGSEYGDLAIKVQMDTPTISEQASWGSIKALFQ